MRVSIPLQLCSECVCSVETMLSVCVLLQLCAKCVRSVAAVLRACAFCSSYAQCVCSVESMLNVWVLLQICAKCVRSVADMLNVCVLLQLCSECVRSVAAMLRVCVRHWCLLLVALLMSVSSFRLPTPPSALHPLRPMLGYDSDTGTSQHVITTLTQVRHSASPPS